MKTTVTILTKVSTKSLEYFGNHICLWSYLEMRCIVLNTIAKRVFSEIYHLACPIDLVEWWYFFQCLFWCWAQILAHSYLTLPSFKTIYLSSKNWLWLQTRWYGKEHALQWYIQYNTSFPNNSRNIMVFKIFQAKVVYTCMW